MPAAILIFSTLALVVFPRAGAAQTNAPVATVVPRSQIETTLEGMAPERVTDLQIRMLDAGGYNVGVGALHRPKVARQGAIHHDLLTEVYYVLEGAGTLVTGGRIVDGRPLDPNGTTYRELAGPGMTGTGVTGGTSQRVAAGDVVIIPAGSPHWFSEIESDLRYIVIRVDPERILPLK